MKFLKKIQALSETKRKILFWVILILVGGLAFWFWLYKTFHILKNLGEDQAFENIEMPEMENLNIDSLEQDLQEFNNAKEALEQVIQDEALLENEELNLE